MKDECRIDVDEVHLENLQAQVKDLAKQSIDWRFLVSVLIPVSLTIGGSLISIAIQVNTMSERMNSLNQSLNVATNTNRRELDMIYSRLCEIEKKGINVKE